MYSIRLTDHLDDALTRIVPIGAPGPLSHPDGTLGAEIAALADPDQPAGAVQILPRPLTTPAKVLLVHVGAGDEAGWRAAGAAAARALDGDEQAQFHLGAAASADSVRGVAEGLWLGGYRYRDGREEPRTAGAALVVDDPSAYGESLTSAEVAARATWLARDLTNAPPSLKNPDWVAEEVSGAAAKRPGLEVRVRAGDELARFGGLRAVGGGSRFRPCLVEMVWNPPGATTHVVLVGKGITFDSGGISIKTRDGMKLMKIDMAGAAAVAAATLAAADLGLPVRVTTLLPLAENAVSGAAYRPGDVITHYDGTTSESTNSDAEGRLVLADALAYAAAELAPDVLIDLATLTGAAKVALGSSIAPLYGDSDELTAALLTAGRAAGEEMWRMPLHGDYRELLRSDVADRHSSPTHGGGMAALFLRDFTGPLAGRWAHIDMAATCWSETSELELTRGATGWGVRTLIRYLSAVSA
ncbi:leucyl aminopeptidase family protein [Paractinoplanes lichenicola]|uniref:Probable cytosol aminopeptidase n=1 Tax=Paractinoplanes lichenicola TaxID=2802976 RepID=A0ABS1VJ85_9ACTN|nr:leucyl aminopeptidase family protein [Actinoplanes lichenicola]MBL7254705.1 leucyl aminopeptidase family protein [Actinoplanes lichenicola]